MNSSKGKINRASRLKNRAALEQFAERVSLIMHKLAGRVLSAERNYLARGIITFPQLWILEHIADAGKCPMRSISLNLGIKSSTVTGIMDRLVELGLVKRSGSESDRRSVLAGVTLKGRRILEQIHVERRRSLVELFGPLSVQERADYLAIIEKVAAQITARE